MLKDSTSAYPNGSGPVHGDTVVGITWEFLQSSRRGAVHVRIATTAQETDDGSDDAFLAERHPVFTVETTDGHRLGHVVTQQLVRLQ